MNCLLDLSFGVLNYGTWGGDLESVLAIVASKMSRPAKPACFN